MGLEKSEIAETPSLKPGRVASGLWELKRRQDFEESAVRL
jgi:hypothetical protein